MGAVLAGSGREWGLFTTLVILGVLAVLAGVFIRRSGGRIKREGVCIANLSPALLATLRGRVLADIAEESGIHYGWPTLVPNDTLVYPYLEPGYHADGFKNVLIGAEAFTKEFINGRLWVVDPSDPKRYYHKDYDRHHPKLPLVLRS